MTEKQTAWAKAALSILWLFAAASFFFPAGGAHKFGQIVFWGMLAAHLVELPFYWRKLKATGTSMAAHIAQVILYGIVYYQGVRKQIAGE